MFTGIIEETGKIAKIASGQVQRINIQSKLENKIGDSICIQGICLTVMKVEKNGFWVESMRQTKEITTLDRWQIGDHVNLERAVRADGRLGGHILLGHVDGVGRLIRIKGNEYFFQTKNFHAQYLIPKGSIGIDGVSLTIGSISKNVFSVSLIPYTLKNTTLGRLRINSLVNIEYDYLAKIHAVKASAVKY